MFVSEQTSLFHALICSSWQWKRARKMVRQSTTGCGLSTNLQQRRVSQLPKKPSTKPTKSPGEKISPRRVPKSTNLQWDAICCRKLSTFLPSLPPPCSGLCWTLSSIFSSTSSTSAQRKWLRPSTSFHPKRLCPEWLSRIHWSSDASSCTSLCACASSTVIHYGSVHGESTDVQSHHSAILR